MATVASGGDVRIPIEHAPEFRRRRFLNWFPLGLTYALLYMGRYNLTVAKTSLGEQIMTKEDFGVIFAAGTATYAIAFLLNGPMVDRIGGRKGMITAAFGSMVMNLVMGAYLWSVLSSGATEAPLRLVFSLLYAGNMYFQSFGAVSIVKVNAHWFHVKERGGFSGIFGTMISSGIFLAFTVNKWLLDLTESWWPDQPSQWTVFFAPGILLGVFGVVELIALRNKPSEAGYADFDTGDASSDDKDDKPLPTLELLKKLVTNPIIITVALIEFCTGVLRNGVMHWFPIYAKEVWALASDHALVYGSWDHLWLIAVMFVVAAISFYIGSRTSGARKGWLFIFGALAFLAPFAQGGWGGLLMVAGVIGGNTAGWVSDLFFQSRRGPAAAGMYGFMALCIIGMAFVLAPPATEVEWAKEDSGLQRGDRIQQLGGRDVEGWADVRTAVRCVPAACIDSGWDGDACTCSSSIAQTPAPPEQGIAARIVRGGETLDVRLPDPSPTLRAGEARKLKARPVLPMSPFVLGALVFLVSLCVIGTHGLLSGTATMDFGGRKGAATAVGLIDGFVYLGTAVQSLSLGYLTSISWSYWPPFLIPFAIVGFLLCVRIWHAKPKGSGAKAAPAKS